MEPIEWQVAAGGQIDADSHGDANVALRSGDWTFALRTDAPEISWTPGGERGRSWVTARGHAFAAQMFLSPWTDGAPDPGRAFNAASAGVEAGWIGYGPAGTYFGGRGSLDGVFPYARPETTALPGARAVGTLDAIFGWYHPAVHGWVRAGVDIASPDGAGADGVTGGAGTDGAPGALRAPHLVGEVLFLPDWSVGALALAPRVEVRAGFAEGQDALLRTRLGGLNPWVVPLAGAAWAEWWVEDYAAARIGGTIGAGEAGARALGVRVSPFVDLATFSGGGEGAVDAQAAVGFGLGARAWRGRAFLDVTGGVAPWIPRAPGVGRASLWFSIGWDWGTAAGPAEETPPGPPGTGWPGG